MRVGRLILAGLALVLLAVALPGCSDGIGHTVPVKGTVKVKGALLSGGSLVYWPNAAKGNTSALEAAAEISADGTFELFTKGRAGARPGWYKVTISADMPPDPDNPYKLKKSPLDKRYQSRDSTPLEIEVADNAPAGRYDLVVP